MERPFSVVVSTGRRNTRTRQRSQVSAFKVNLELSEALTQQGLPMIERMPRTAGQYRKTLLKRRSRLSLGIGQAVLPVIDA